jgi:hypothetical protein
MISMWMIVINTCIFRKALKKRPHLLQSFIDDIAWATSRPVGSETITYENTHPLQSDTAMGDTSAGTF